MSNDLGETLAKNPEEQPLVVMCKGCIQEVNDAEAAGREAGHWRWAASRMLAKLKGSLLTVECDHHGTAARFSVLMTEPPTAVRRGDA